MDGSRRLATPMPGCGRCTPRHCTCSRAVLIICSILLVHFSVVRAPPTRPSLRGSQEENDGVFPQVGTGAAELSHAYVADALSEAMEQADLDGSGGLSWTEIGAVFARIRAQGDPVWTRLDEAKFYRIFGDSQKETRDASFQSVYNTVTRTNLELDWRAPDQKLEHAADDAEATLERKQYYESVHHWRLDKHAPPASNGEVEAQLMAEEP